MANHTNHDDRLMMTEQAKLMAERAQNNHSFVYIKIPQGNNESIKVLVFLYILLSPTHRFIQQWQSKPKTHQTRVA